MRYIAIADNLVLYQKNGEAKYRFYNGELIIGDPTLNTLAADKMDFQDADDKALAHVYKTDLAGATTAVSEMMGLGGIDVTGTYEVSRGLFFEAPPIGIGATTVEAVANICYTVLKGNVTYAGTTYYPNEQFFSDGTITTTTGTDGVFALALRHQGLNDKVLRNHHFMDKLLLDGDEPANYQIMSLGGFEPRNSISTVDIGDSGYGWYK